MTKSSKIKMDADKIVHTLILDTGPIIKNIPSISTLLSCSHDLITIPALEVEIRDAATRSRYETTIKPFLTFRDPTPASVNVVRDFARRSGDLAVLSRPDVAILALAYELECERNGGDWRLRKTPGQKGLNGKPPLKEEIKGDEGNEGIVDSAPVVEGNEQTAAHMERSTDEVEQTKTAEDEVSRTMDNLSAELETAHMAQAEESTSTTEESSIHTSAEQQLALDVDAESKSDPDSDSEGWITPLNLSAHIAADASGTSTTTSSINKAPSILQVATLTTDFAMQNVLLLMNLNLLSATSTPTRIRHLKTFILRCHACFNTVKDTSKQFCPRCGGANTLTRVACSTDSQTGEFKLHLKKNMQWNTRGNVYSIPKPVAGSANGRISGGGKGGWGKELILVEDQKEFLRAGEERERAERRARKMDDWDDLPGLISGERGGQGWAPGSRIRVGAGRNVNGRKRK